jgi:hypothetical protein
MILGREKRKEGKVDFSNRKGGRVIVYLEQLDE